VREKDSRGVGHPPDTVDRLLAIRQRYLIDVREPLVLIAQPNRSGGTLLSQLFDGHPEVHVNPGELHWQQWPSLDLTDSPRVWVKALGQRHLGRSFREGFSKDKPARKLGYDDQLQNFPLMLDPRFHRRLFLTLAAERPPATQRDVLDLYFTALFNAWVDNQNLYGGPKRWTLAFRGRMRHPDNLARFFHDYPDGRHITCVREPKARTASKLMYSGERQGVSAYADTWRAAAERQLQAKERYGERVFLLTFERLVTETEKTMSTVAAWLGIRFDPILTQPTFNRFPIKANSSFPVDGQGVLRAPLENWRRVLSDEQAEIIDGRTRDLYERICAVAET
jgi:sulfotransferase family protein